MLSLVKVVSVWLCGAILWSILVTGRCVLKVIMTLVLRCDLVVVTVVLTWLSVVLLKVWCVSLCLVMRPC